MSKPFVTIRFDIPADLHARLDKGLSYGIRGKVFVATFYELADNIEKKGYDEITRLLKIGESAAESEEAQ